MRTSLIAMAMIAGALPLTAAAQQQTRLSTEEERRAADAKRPDTPGTGAYPALKKMDARLPDHVVYRPANLAALGGKKLGVLLWGNGGCAADGASARFHLAEIASHGYVVIAPGRIRSGPGAEPSATPPAPRQPEGAPRRLPPIATTAKDVAKGLDWILAENARADSRYKGLIDPAQVAVAGHSCGGLQAIQVAPDPRIKTVIINNSGVFTDGTNPIQGLVVDKSMLRGIHTPVLYVLGGKGDIAWPNGTDDFARIDHVPAVLVDGDVGHGGTFGEENGGDVARFTVAWLDWQLRGDETAGRLFKGPDCGLCTDAKWRIQRKGL